MESPGTHDQLLSSRSLPSGPSLSLITPPALQSLLAHEIADWAVNAGFTAIDTEADLGQTTVDAFAGAGIALGPMRIRASLADSDQTSRHDALEHACLAIDRAAEHGIATVWTLPRNARNDASPRTNFAAALESLEALATYAERQNIRIAIENCPFEGQNAVCTPESWDALFAAIPSPALGICMDPSHCVWQGIDYLRATREYRHRLYDVHAKDTELLPEGLFRYGVQGPLLEEVSTENGWPRHGWWRHRLPGLGAVDWSGFITTLADIGYSGAISIEHEDPLWGGSPDRVQRGLAQAREHLARLIP
ncbi:MAG: sugar phosphate isomerase/epimerase [Chloroflexia bacterium]|nr:sugar phosphate isomerase/epimerase [Chloroflexia bacterium]